MSPRLVTLSSVLTRPANTTAYAQNDLIASSVTAGSIVVPHFTLPADDAQGVEILRGRLYTDLTSGFTTFQGHVDLWDAAPTFTNGDNGAYAIATGAAHWLAHLTSNASSAYDVAGDGAFLALNTGSVNSASNASVAMGFARSRGDLLYWSLREIDSTGFTPASGQTFTLKLDVLLR